MMLERCWLVIVAYLASCECAEESSRPPSEETQNEVAKNIILLEHSNCNFRLSSMECFNLKIQAKWKYINTFLKGYKCKWGSVMDLQASGLDASTYVVKCPGKVKGRRPARVYPLLTDSYLSDKGIVFREGGVIHVPGEGTMPVSEDWDNGTADQRMYRLEIGNNICDWDKRNTLWAILFTYLQDTEAYVCVLDLAKVYYISTYSPTGSLGDCTPGQLFDLHLPSKCQVVCPIPDHAVEYAEYAFTKANMFSTPFVCEKTNSGYWRLMGKSFSYGFDFKTL